MYIVVESPKEEVMSLSAAERKLAELARNTKKPVFLFKVERVVNPTPKLRKLESPTSLAVMENRFLAILSQCSAMSAKVLFENRRKKDMIYRIPRNLHIIFRRKCMGLSLPVSGIAYGKSHSTCKHIFKAMRDLFDTNDSCLAPYKPVIQEILRINPKAFEDDKL